MKYFIVYREPDEVTSFIHQAANETDAQRYLDKLSSAVKVQGMFYGVEVQVRTQPATRTFVPIVTPGT